MKKLTVFLFIILCLTATYAQTIVNQKNKTENLPVYVKHLNVLTGKETPWRLNTDNEGPETASTPAFNGIPEFFNLNDKGLKSLDFIGKITENPGFPEEAVVYTKNLTKNDLTSATMINSAFALASGNEYRSVAQSPGLIHIASFNFIKNETDYEHAFATDIYFFGSDTTDFANNLALIKLNRPLGVFTGWMGYGYHTDDDFYKETSFFITHLDLNDNVYELHKYAAKADIVYNDNFLFAPRQILTNGAPYYRESGAAHGILTHLAWTTDFSKYWNGATRITKEKYNIISSAISNDLPDQFDLLPLKLNMEPYKVTTGEKLEKLSFYLHNYSEATFSGQIKLHVYLSKDKSIDSTDIRLVSYTMDTQMEPLKFFNIGPSVPPEIPYTIESGKYYAGVIIENSDAETGNNTTQGIDIDSLEVENPYATNYISGKIITSGESSGEGWCLLLKHHGDVVRGLQSITEVDETLNFEFKNVFTGDYVIVYVPKNSNNHRNIPTYYNQTPYWQNATIISLTVSDTVRNIELERIELPEKTGTKVVSGVLSQSENKSAKSTADDFFSDVTLFLENSETQSVYSSSAPDNTGAYRFEDVTNGTYSVLVDKPGFTLNKSAQVTITDETEIISDVNFEFHPDSTISTTYATAAPFYSENDIKMTVYPNPARQTVTVSFASDPGEYFIELYNSLGQITLQIQRHKRTEELDLHKFEKGIYYLKIYSDKFSKREKLILK